MIKKYNEEFLGRNFRGNWPNSPIFTFGEVDSMSAWVTWHEEGEFHRSSYPIWNIFDLMKEGTWIIIEKL